MTVQVRETSAASAQGTRIRWPGPPVHPLLFAAFPVLFLYHGNLRGGVRPGDLVVPLALSVMGAAALFALFRLLLGNLHRAAIATSVLVLLFLSFGHVELAADPARLGGARAPLLLTWVALALLGLAAAVRARRPAFWSFGLNLIAAVLVVMNLVPIVSFELTDTDERIPVTGALPGVDPGAVTDRRDVYYLIFDRYARADTLRELYRFDNDPFLSFLRARGFYAAEDSVANYPKTTQSLAASLNMTFLDDLAQRVGVDSGDWGPLNDSLSGSRAARGFQELGYDYHHIGSWWEATASDPAADVNHVFSALPEFSGVFVDTTMWPAVAELVGLREPETFEREQHERVLFQFREIEEISRLPEPTFTFAHFTLPHPPYVFDARGTFVSRQDSVDMGRVRAYIEQLRFTNLRIDELVAELLVGPDETDPIVVIQSDEGPEPVRAEASEAEYRWDRAPLADLQEKLRILNAYYLPGVGSEQLYPSISPVNTFRLILSSYFGADLPLLPDRTWVFQDQGHPYRYTEVTPLLHG
ncbi:MAG: hypothetical protein ACRDHS_11580 [Actinomycetota bacterium]